MRIAKSRVHFIGIGGIGMCGLAELLHNMGATVTGSDLNVNAQVEYLKKLGIQIFEGHAPENVGSAEVVVYSSAVKDDNHEIHSQKYIFQNNVVCDHHESAEDPGCRPRLITIHGLQKSQTCLSLHDKW